MKADYQKFTVSDFATDPYFIEWIRKPDAENNRFWQTFLLAYPVKREAVEEARQLVQALAQDKDAVMDWELDEIWQRLSVESKADVNKKTGHAKVIPFPSLFNRKVITAAAVGLLMLISSLVLFTVFKTSTIEYSTKYGEKRTVQLPDGSTVILNGHSKISFQDNWSANKTREVELDGEAYFSITHQANHQKFIVHTTEDIQVEVLGTEFNVSDRGQTSQVVLASGKVRLRIEEKQQIKELVMKPGDLIEVKEQTHQIRQQIVRPELYTSWKDNRLIFDDTSLNEIAKMLEHNYGYKVIFRDPALAHLKVTASFQIKNLRDILYTLSETFGIQITQTQNTIEIHH